MGTHGDEASDSDDETTKPSAADARAAEQDEELSAELANAVVKQIEFYFSDASLPSDKKLLKQIRKTPEGWVPIKVFANFRKVRAMTRSLPAIARALQSSTVLVLSADSKQLRRLIPVPEYDIDDIQRRTVVVENLPVGSTIESVTKLMKPYGKVKLVRICSRETKGKLPTWLTTALGSAALHSQPSLGSRSSYNSSVYNGSVTGPLLSTAGSLTPRGSEKPPHAYVEFESEEEAIMAVAALHDTEGWRPLGVQVSHLIYACSDTPKRAPTTLARAASMAHNGRVGGGSRDASPGITSRLSERVSNGLASTAGSWRAGNSNTNNTAVGVGGAAHSHTSHTYHTVGSWVPGSTGLAGSVTGSGTLTTCGSDVSTGSPSGGVARKGSYVPPGRRAAEAAAAGATSGSVPSSPAQPSSPLLRHTASSSPAPALGLVMGVPVSTAVGTPSPLRHMASVSHVPAVDATGAATRPSSTLTPLNPASVHAPPFDPVSVQLRPIRTGSSPGHSGGGAGPSPLSATATAAAAAATALAPSPSATVTTSSGAAAAGQAPKFVRGVPGATTPTKGSRGPTPTASPRAGASPAGSPLGRYSNNGGTPAPATTHDLTPGAITFQPLSPASGAAASPFLWVPTHGPAPAPNNPSSQQQQQAGVSPSASPAARTAAPAAALAPRGSTGPVSELSVGGAAPAAGSIALPGLPNQAAASGPAPPDAAQQPPGSRDIAFGSFFTPRPPSDVVASAAAAAAAAAGVFAPETPTGSDAAAPGFSGDAGTAAAGVPAHAPMPAGVKRTDSVTGLNETDGAEERGSPARGSRGSRGSRARGQAVHNNGHNSNGEDRLSPATYVRGGAAGALTGARAGGYGGHPKEGGGGGATGAGGVREPGSPGAPGSGRGKHSKADYASWAAATPEYRAEAVMKYAGEHGTPSPPAHPGAASLLGSAIGAIRAAASPRQRAIAAAPGSSPVVGAVGTAPGGAAAGDGSSPAHTPGHVTVAHGPAGSRGFLGGAGRGRGAAPLPHYGFQGWGT